MPFTLEELIKIRDSSIIFGIKLYPSGVTTNSDKGVNSIDDCFHIFEGMEKNDIPLLIHGEVNDPDVDIFDREKVFIDRHLEKITKQFPNLKTIKLVLIMIIILQTHILKLNLK